MTGGGQDGVDAGVPRPLRIAMIGTRGLPASYGGIEHHVEQIGARLAEMGHEVTVYSRPDYGLATDGEHRGMRVKVLPAMSSKHLEAFSHSAAAALDVVRHGGYDVVHFHALGPGLMSPLVRLRRGTAIVQTIHGLDDERDKWGRSARLALYVGRQLSARVPDATIVVSPTLRRVYAERHGRDTTFIPNGGPPVRRLDLDELGPDLGLEAGRYLLYVGRLVPEKRPDLLLRAFRDVDTDLKLVLLGGSSHTNDMVETLEALAADDPRVVMAGYRYGDDVTRLYSNARAFVLPSALEGLPLTALEAMSGGAGVILSDIGPHVDLCGESGPGRRLFPVDDQAGLTDVLQAAADDPLWAGAPDEAELFRKGVLEEYSWDRAARLTAEVYDAAAARRR